MHFSDITQQLEHIFGFDERVVMIRQHAPGDDASGLWRYGFQECFGECRHALRVFADNRSMLETRGGEQIVNFVAGAMREAVPRETLQMTESHQLVALFWREFAPEIHGLECRL